MYLSIHPSIYLLEEGKEGFSTYLSIYLFIYIYLSIGTYARMHVYAGTHAYVCMYLDMCNMYIYRVGRMSGVGGSGSGSGVE